MVWGRVPLSASDHLDSVITIAWNAHQLSHNSQIGYGAPAQSADHAADAQPTIRGFKEEGF